MDFKVGDKVFIKLKGYPHWPEIVERVISNNGTGKSLKYYVQFFGSHDHATVKHSDLYSYEENILVYGQPKADNYRNKKFNAALKEAEEKEINLTQPCTEVNEISKKIDNLEKTDDLDLETSLTLAAEAGNALLTENTKLRQDLQFLQDENVELIKELEKRSNDIQFFMEVEASCKEKDEIIKGLTDKKNELLQETSFIRKRADEERNLKEELIQQSELEIQSLTNKIKQLQCNLIEQTNLSEQSEKALKQELNSLTNREERLKQEIIDKNSTIAAMRNDTEKLLLKLTEQEQITKSYLSAFFSRIKSHTKHSNIVLNNSHLDQLTTQTLYTNSLPLDVSLQDELSISCFENTRMSTTANKTKNLTADQPATRRQYFCNCTLDSRALYTTDSLFSQDPKSETTAS
ncbi:hypothetical protein J6590_032326 [Homalodisca vitripennis]|nr:hypothetical protein J6590_032326 [Homalodisca vitripennis]